MKNVFLNPPKSRDRVSSFLIEKVANTEIGSTFAVLRSMLTGKGCVVISEEAPVSVVVKQGSIWGMSPQHAKKTVKYVLSPAGSGTRVSAYSKIASDWKYLSAGGCVLAIVMSLLCFWISVDLEGFVTMHQLSWWGWLVTVNGYVDVQLAQVFANLLKFVAVFLLVVIIAEAAVVVYAYYRVDQFAEESLASLA